MTGPSVIYQRGDFVEITAGGRTVDGMVAVASPCGKSLIVMFDAILDGHVAAMPLVGDVDGFVSLITGNRVILRSKGQALNS